MATKLNLTSTPVKVGTYTDWVILTSKSGRDFLVAFGDTAPANGIGHEVRELALGFGVTVWA